MTHDKTSAASQSGYMARLGQLGRMSAFFMTAGFAYPNVMVEGVDIAKLDAATKAKTLKP